MAKGTNKCEIQFNCGAYIAAKTLKQVLPLMKKCKHYSGGENAKECDWFGVYADDYERDYANACTNFTAHQDAVMLELAKDEETK